MVVIVAPCTQCKSRADLESGARDRCLAARQTSALRLVPWSFPNAHAAAARYHHRRCGRAGIPAMRSTNCNIGCASRRSDAFRACAGTAFCISFGFHARPPEICRPIDQRAPLIHGRHLVEHHNEAYRGRRRAHRAGRRETRDAHVAETIARPALTRAFDASARRYPRAAAAKVFFDFKGRPTYQ